MLTPEDAALLRELQEQYDYEICGELFEEEDAGELFCTCEKGHEGQHDFV